MLVGYAAERGDREAAMGERPSRMIRSSGELSARGATVVVVAPPVREPAPVAERVILVDPRRTSPCAGTPAGAGPRRPDQMRWPQRARGVERPDGRPLTKAQRFWIDPDLLARWEAEERGAAST
jgi:hypothetical protein